MCKSNSCSNVCLEDKNIVAKRNLHKYNIGLGGGDEIYIYKATMHGNIL